MKRWIVTDFEDGKILIEEMVIEGNALIQIKTRDEIPTHQSNRRIHKKADDL